MKGLVAHFQKMVMFIMLWFIVSDILGFEVKELFKSSAKLASFLII